MSKFKHCSLCKTTKYLIHFCKNSNSKSGYNYSCKECQKEYYLKNKVKILQNTKIYSRINKVKISKSRKIYTNNNKKYKQKYDKIYNLKNKDIRTNNRFKRTYGISLNDYNILFIKQKRICAICYNKETRRLNGKIVNLSVDHNHKTGKVRGLLCSQCNRSLGGFKDDIKLLKKAIYYLKD